MVAPEQPQPTWRGFQSFSSLSPPRGARTLLVRHLPAELSAEERQALLKYFGAQSVRVLPDKGRLKRTAFATFPSESSARKALARLHQLKLFGHTLVVEFAKEQEQVHALPPSHSEKRKGSDVLFEDNTGKEELGVLPIENGIAPNHGLTFPLNPQLKYLYPPPSETILANIANALASVPKFYVQVLHLMNKMNLPPPFGPITAKPPLCEDYKPLQVPPPSPPPPPPAEKPPLPDEEEELSSQESEYESSDDEDRRRMIRLLELANRQPQRPKPKKRSHVRKKRKIQGLLHTPASASHSQVHAVLLPSDVFDQPQPVHNKKIEFRISTSMPAASPKKNLELEGRREEQSCDAPAAEVDTPQLGFGKIFPTPRLNITEDVPDGSSEMPSEFISRKELERGRISAEEMETLSVFKNYEAGEPNCRIYVKNLAKQVRERDLQFVFGRYVDFSSETEGLMFDIRLMKEGSLRGQAFIGLPHEKAAAAAVKEANGYVLLGKPMVVQFARSARPRHGCVDGKESVKRKRRENPVNGGM